MHVHTYISIPFGVYYVCTYVHISIIAYSVFVVSGTHEICRNASRHIQVCWGEGESRHHEAGDTSSQAGPTVGEV